MRIDTKQACHDDFHEGTTPAVRIQDYDRECEHLSTGAMGEFIPILTGLGRSYQHVVIWLRVFHGFALAGFMKKSKTYEKSGTKPYQAPDNIDWVSRPKCFSACMDFRSKPYQHTLLPQGRIRVLDVLLSRHNMKNELYQASGLVWRQQPKQPLDRSCQVIRIHRMLFTTPCTSNGRPAQPRR